MLLLIMHCCFMNHMQMCPILQDHTLIVEIAANRLKLQRLLPSFDTEFYVIFVGFSEPALKFCEIMLTHIEMYFFFPCYAGFGNFKKS